MPKININGLVREMTAEEIAEMQERMQDLPEALPESMEQKVERLLAFKDKITDALERIGIRLPD